MPLDAEVGRTKTVYVQLVDHVGNIRLLTATIERNLMPVGTLSIPDKLSALPPIFDLTATDADNDVIDRAELSITGPVNRTVTLWPFASSYSYDPQIDGPLPDGMYTVTAAVYDALGLSSDPVIKTFVMNTNADPDQVIVIPPADGEKGNNPPTGQWIGIGSLTFHYTTGKAMENTLEIYNQSNVLIRSLSQGLQPAGSHSVTWDGRDATGSLVPSGRYRIMLKSFDGLNTFEVEILTLDLDTAPPQIIWGDPSPTYTNSTIDFLLQLLDDQNAPGLLSGSVELNDSEGNVLTTWSVPGDLVIDELAGSYTPLDEGVYTLTARIRDPQHNESVSIQTYFVDRTDPEIVSVLYPLGTGSTSETIFITAKDASGIASISVNGAVQTLNVLPPDMIRTEANVILSGGSNKFTIVVTDIAGNSSTQEITIVYTPPSTPSSGETTNEQKPSKDGLTEEQLRELLGVPKDTEIIDLRDMEDTGGKDSRNVQIASSGGDNVTLSYRPADLSTIDLNKALDEQGLRDLLNDADTRIQFQYLKFEDAIGLRLIVIGKDGSVNELQIDLPMLASYEVPVGEDPTEWGVFKLDNSGKWIMVPSFVTPAGKLEARIGTGYYKAQKMAQIPVELNSKWALPAFTKMYNMGGVYFEEGYDDKEFVTLNELLNMMRTIAPMQQFRDMIEVLDNLNLNKQNLSRQELVVIANMLLQTELEITVKNFAGDTRISLLQEFNLNADGRKLDAYVDSFDVFEYYRTELAIAANYKLIVGRPSFILAPDDLINRSEAVQMIINYAEFAGKVKYDAMK